MNDEHTWIGRALTDYVFEEEGTLLCGGIGTKGLYNWVDIVVNCLGHTNYHYLSAVLLEDVLRQFGSLGVCIITADGVDDLQ